MERNGVMALSPRHPVDVVPAGNQRTTSTGTLDRLTGKLFRLLGRCGWRWATAFFAGAMMLLGFGVVATLDVIIDSRHSHLLLAAVMIGLLATPCLAVAFKLVEHLGRARTRLLDEIERRIAAEQQFRQLATTDELTGIGNRRHFIGRAHEAIDVARRYGQWCSVAVIDVDRFKDINDQRGHLAGDDALVMLATVLEANRRASDFAARLGGDEFIVLMPLTAPDAARAAAERIRAAIHQDSGHNGLSVSIGVAAVQGDEATLDDLIARADRSLYAAKRTGRNRVMGDVEAASPWSHANGRTFSMAS